MKKIFCYIISICLILFLGVGCADSINESNSENSEKIFYSDVVLVWAIPNIYFIDNKNLNSLNKYLFDNGYEFNIDFIYLSYENYFSELENYSGSIDIAFSGFDTDENTSCELIRSGYFAELDNLLKNSVLFDQYSKKQWHSMDVDGKIYSIPNLCATDNGVSYIFNNNYINKESIENFDMKFSSIKNLLGESSKKDDFSDIIYLIDGFSFCLLDNNYYENGFIFSEKNKSINALFYDDESIDFFRTLNSFYNEGYINYNLSLYGNGTDDSEYGSMISSGNFKIIITDEDTGKYKHNDDLTIKTTRPIIHSRTSGGVGISADSQNKEMAFELLTIVRTNPDILKYLVLENPDDTKSVSFIAEMVIGDNYFSQTAINIKKYYDDSVLESVFLGFNVDYSNMYNLSEINNICIQNLDIWKSVNFEEDINLIQQKLNHAGINDEVSEINEQFRIFETKREQL